MSDKTRQEFEEFAKHENYSLRRHKVFPTSYRYERTQAAWHSWQHQQSVANLREAELSALLGHIENQQAIIDARDAEIAKLKGTVEDLAALIISMEMKGSGS